MKYILQACFFLMLFSTPVAAQFKTIKIAESNYPNGLTVLAASKPGQLFMLSQSSVYASSDSALTWQISDAKQITDSSMKHANRYAGLNNETYIVFVDAGIIKMRMETKSSSTTYTVAHFKNGERYLINDKLVSNGLPGVACDMSYGKYQGRIYVCWSDEKYGTSNKDVFVSFTDNKGITWTEPILVTYRPNHKQQFMPHLSVDQTNGFVYIVYYDQQNSSDGSFTDIYMARSMNGGLLFDTYKLNENPISLKNVTSLGNQTGITASHSILRPFWVQPEKNNKSGFYTAIVDEPAMIQYWKNQKEDLEMERSFTLTEKTKLNYTLKEDAVVTAVITNPLNHTFEKTVFKNKKIKKGAHELLIDTKKLGLKKESYTLTFYYNNKNTYVWLVDE